jgi:hypothetical protein
MSFKRLASFRSSLRTAFRAASQGLSLLEMAMVIAVVSISLMPVIQTLNGVRSGTGEGPADRRTAFKSKEALLANTLVEQALAGDYSRFNCDPATGNTIAFNPNTDFPAAGATKTFNRCSSSSYNQTIYYQWTMYSVPNLPAQNQYYRASLNIYTAAAGGTSVLTLQSNFFRNVGAYATGNDSTGIMLAMDTSGSMTSAQVEGPLASYDSIASPYMFYRYSEPLFENTAYNSSSGSQSFPAGFVPGHLASGVPSPEVILNPWDNTQLDMSFAQGIKPPNVPDFSDPDTTTPYNEKFPYSHSGSPDPKWGEGILGTGECGSTTNNDWTGSDRNLTYTFLPGARSDTFYFPGLYVGGRQAIQQLCQPKDSASDLNDTLNLYMSRAEAARTGALTMLLNLESNPAITPYIELGFIPWNSTPDNKHLITPEAAVTTPFATGLHFVASRKKFLWINRADPSNASSLNPVRVGGSTNIYLGLETARQQLMAKNYSRRVIVLLTDGEPNPNSGSNSSASLKSYALNTLGNNAPSNQQVTLFTIGLIEADQNLLGTMASNTPSGQAYFATDLSQVRNIFESVAYQIQKLALLNAVRRYGLNL